jgi:hypothetical protein
MIQIFIQNLVKPGRPLLTGWLLVFLLTVFFYSAYAQKAGFKVTGTVFDSKGESVIGCTVKLKGTTIATSTDVNGNFPLTLQMSNPF